MWRTSATAHGRRSEGKSAYEANAAAYLTKLDALDAEVRATVENIRQTGAGSSRRTMPSAISPRPIASRSSRRRASRRNPKVSAKDGAKIITQIRNRRSGGVPENVTDKRLLERIVRRAARRSAATLYSDALTDERARATYLDMMRHNVKQIAAALTS